MSAQITSGLSFTKKQKTANIRINEIDVNYFFKSIKNENNLIILDNVLIDNFDETLRNIITQFTLEITSEFIDANDFRKIMKHIYTIFLYNFILYLVVFDPRFYKLDKHVNVDGTTIFNIAQLKLSDNDLLDDKIRADFTKPDTIIQYNKSIYFQNHKSQEICFGHFYKNLKIDYIVNNEYAIYKTNRNEFIIFDVKHVTNDDLEKLCSLNNCTLHIKNKFNLPEFIRENDERLKNYLSKKYIYPRFNEDKIDNLMYYEHNNTLIFFDKISSLYNKYISLEQPLKTGGNNKYKICINKKTNYAYIIHNKKKCYFYKNENKIYIKLANNNNIYINKKLLSYDNKSNSYFIIIR